MNKKININPSSTKWLEKDDRVVADYFCDLGFRSLKQILDMRVFDLMNMQGLNAVRVEEVIICLPALVSCLLYYGEYRNACGGNHWSALVRCRYGKRHHQREP